MRLDAMRRATRDLGLAGFGLLAALTSADAQVTYQTGAPLPGALPPIDTPAPAPTVVPAPVPVVPAPMPPADMAPTTAAAPSSDKADVNNPIKQTGEVVKDLVKGDVKALREGPLLIHGNYCGIGNRPNAMPTDALDEACMHHDACTTEGKMPSCACDNRLQAEAMRISRDPSQPQKIQALATTMAASMAILICK